MSELKLKPCPFCGGTDIDIRTNDYGLSWYSFCNDCGVMCGYAMTKDDVMNAWNMRAEKIEEAPTVDAVQVKQGRWIKCTHHHWEERFKCSKCGYDTEVDTVMGKPIYNFCPYCGAKMDGER